MKNDNLLACEIVHRLRGRIRIKSKAFKYIGNSLKSEIEKLIPVYMKITGEEIEKINHFTSLNETVKVNKNSNSQWEMERLGLF